MIKVSTVRPMKVVLLTAFALGLAALTACGGGKPATPVAQGQTAKAALPVAQSAMTTIAPDAKLLLVQTAEAVTPTATPVWAYLFGSPATDKAYVVYVDKGKATPASQYGNAGLTKAEWAVVPGIDAWKIDSDQAYTKALAASGAKGAPAAYGMAFVTYVPKSAGKTTIKAFVWNVSFEPGTSGAATGTIGVDAKTGAVTATK